VSCGGMSEKHATREKPYVQGAANGSLLAHGYRAADGCMLRDLGVLLDSESTLKQHTSKFASCCCYHIGRLRQISRNDSSAVIISMMHLTSAFLLSSLDYCNIIQAGLSKSSIATLQRVQNVAARLVLGLGPRDHIADGLRQLQLVSGSGPYPIQACLLMHMVHTGRCPPYLKDVLLPVSSSSDRNDLRSATNYVMPRLRTVYDEGDFFAYILLLLPSNSSLRPIFLLRFLSFQFNFILVYYC